MSENVPAEETIVISGEAQVQFASMIALAHALALEINTGMRASRRSMLAVAQSNGYTVKRTKKGALKDLVKLIKAGHPDRNWEPSGSVARAIK